ncbi:FMN-binding negative transcriptional regulator [Wenzhouxiangella sp. AB-CW3]|uniref:FMN-binding negative transcriptional regulator n=1 Tax=Wenzhouxiangella sp. AB-CW3 TaxID=2771012 RepID=UPI00168B3BA9|nr:FMN-binding negative transcriptional regulator [Wenzhouxiangella sp. AB-CW3]QOC23017.1 FMN-binding negative transcriptional regulator [Wenzhouxiangella sp. AB-CW3]
MYPVSHYKERDERAVLAFVRRHPFAFLTGCGAAGVPVATQVPLLVEQEGDRTTLSGHLMRNTDHHEAFVLNSDVLAVFTGPHAYVSATWYSNPAVASTWNYMSVHARGVIRFVDSDGLESILQRSSLHFEGGNEQSPTVYDNLPASFKNKVIKAIVGFEIEVTRLDAVFKLSQDKDDHSIRNIIKELGQGAENDRLIAAEMEKRSG